MDVLAALLGPRAGKGDEIGATMEPKNHVKSLKKGIENYFFFLLVLFGAQGGPRDHFLIDFGSIFDRF